MFEVPHLIHDDSMNDQGTGITGSVSPSDSSMVVRNVVVKTSTRRPRADFILNKRFLSKKAFKVQFGMGCSDFEPTCEAPTKRSMVESTAAYLKNKFRPQATINQVKAQCLRKTKSPASAKGMRRNFQQDGTWVSHDHTEQVQ